MIEDAGAAGFPWSSLVSRVGVDPRALDARVEALTRSGAAVRAGDVLVTPAVFERLKSAMLAALGDHHRREPLSEGVPREELRERVFARGHADVFERALTDLAAAGTIVSRDRVALCHASGGAVARRREARVAIERAFPRRRSQAARRRGGRRGDGRAERDRRTRAEAPAAAESPRPHRYDAVSRRSAEAVESGSRGAEEFGRRAPRALTSPRSRSDTA